MQIECFTVGGFGVNTYLVTDDASGKSAIIDTGESAELLDILKARDPAPQIEKILLTHAHIDHAGALSLLQEQWPEAQTVLPKLEKKLFDTLPMQGTMFGMPHLNRPCGRVDRFIEDGESVMVGESELKFISTPGHTPGQGCYYNDRDIVVGDTLFAGSIGRTDFPLSDPQLMVESLRNLLELPETLNVHSGHGPVTTLGEELRNNPFLAFIRRERGMPEGRSIRWAQGT